MGGRLVSAAFAQWPRLPHAPMRLLTFMASVARDDDVPPRYYGGAVRLAHALGHPLPPAGEPLPRAASAAVERHLRALTEAGAVTRLRAPGPDHPATYRLDLSAMPDAQLPALSEGRAAGTGTQLPALSEGRSPLTRPDRPALSVSTPRAERGQRPALSVSTPRAERGAQHQEHEGTPPTPVRASTSAVTGEALAAVVVEELGELGATITGPTLAEALACAARNGWTPTSIRRAVRDRRWAGAQGGAVVAWARGLGQPPPPTRTPSAPACPRHPDQTGGARNCPRCQAESSPAPPNLRELIRQQVAP